MCYTVSIPFVLVAVLLTACSSDRASQTSGEPPIQKAAPFVLKGVTGIQRVARLIGPDSINKTHEPEVCGE